MYAIQSARWKTVLGQRLPVLTPWEKGLSEALACPGTMSGEEVAAAIRTAFQKYLRFDGTAHAKTPLTLHFGERWAPLLTKLFTTEMVRTDDLAIGRSAAAGENGMVRASNALRSRLRSNERETEDRDYVERCFGTAPETIWAATSGSPVGSRRPANRSAPMPSGFFNRQRSRPSETGPLTSKTATSIKAPSCG